MTSIIKFTPLCGAISEDPLCYLLEVDEYRILLDCGWNDDFDVEILKPLKRVIGKINLVLISHPDLAHLGALPYAVGKLGLTAKIIGTIPVHQMGQMFMYDAYQSKKNFQDFDLFDLDDVDVAFENVVQLKYSQHYTVTDNGIKLEITPFAAGHIVGGTVWQIKRETDEIVYAVDYNHKKERHLSPTVLETLNQPSLLITDSLNALNTQVSRRNRDSALFDSILSTLRGGGNVLLPIDTAGRALELLLILDQHWSYYHHSYPLVFLSNVSYNTVEFAKSQLEWMSEGISKKFVTNRENAFVFSHVKTCHKISEVNELPNPKLVLASNGDLGSSFSQQLFVDWCSDAKNRVIFTDRSRPGTIARRLMENPRMGKLYIKRWTRVPLAGDELAEFQRNRRIEREAELTRKRQEQEIARKKREQIEMYDYEGEDADLTASLSTMWQNQDFYPDLIRHELAQQNRGQAQKKLPFPMFPCIEKKSIFDDYGESIRPEDFMLVTEDILSDNITTFKVRNDTIDSMDVDEAVDIPTKSVLQSCELSVNCAIQYIDFEGRSDGRSIKKILNHVQPRKLILVHGTKEATDHLAQYCLASANPPKRVLSPHVGETVDVTEATNLYRLHLKSNFLESLDFKALESKVSVAFVDGILMVPPQEKDEEGQWNQPEPYLDVLPHGEYTLGHEAVFIGDVKLSSFRQKLHEMGFKTEFRDGALVVNGTVALRRDAEQTGGKGSIHVEGAISEEYYKIREILYKQFQIL